MVLVLVMGIVAYFTHKKNNKRWIVLAYSSGFIRLSERIEGNDASWVGEGTERIGVSF
jgi:hypothetical protein